MTALDLTSFAPALKEHYTDQRIENMVYKNQPFLALLKKYEKFGGKDMPIPLQYANPAGRSATFSVAQTNKLASKYVAFALTRARDYAVASIDNETIEASVGDANAFMEAATREIDSALHAVSRSMGHSLFGSGSGSIGRCVGTTSPITLVNPEDIVNFEVGMVLVANDEDNATSLRSGSHIITGVNRDAGTYTFTGTITSLTASDFLFVEGDPGAKISGLAAWVPPAAPTSASFFGVDRTVDITRLAGVRQVATTKPIEEALIDLATRIGREGGTPDHCFMSFGNYGNLVKALGSKVQYIQHKVGEISFDGVMVHGAPKGAIKVIPDFNCPSNYAWMVQLDTWCLNSIGKAPKILSTDGLKMLRDGSADSVEVRVGMYGNLSCDAPGYNGVVQLS